jgi:predicted RNase H-like HicB family nuclease
MKIPVQRRFKVILEWNEDDGGHTVTVPTLPGCITEGDTVDQALERAQKAIEGHIEALKLVGKPAPEGDVHIAEVQVNVS